MMGKAAKGSPEVSRLPAISHATRDLPEIETR